MLVDLFSLPPKGEGMSWASPSAALQVVPLCSKSLRWLVLVAPRHREYAGTLSALPVGQGSPLNSQHQTHWPLHFPSREKPWAEPPSHSCAGSGEGLTQEIETAFLTCSMHRSWLWTCWGYCNFLSDFWNYIVVKLFSLYGNEVWGLPIPPSCCH